MNNSRAVGCLECCRHLQRDIEQSSNSHGPARDRFTQVLPFQQFHGDERPSGIITDFVDRADVWMVQRRCRTRLSPESLECALILSHLFRQELQSNWSAEIYILSLVHD